MRAKGILIFGAVAALGYTLWQKTQAVKNLQWQVAGLKLDKQRTGWQKTAFAVTVRMYNPTATSVAFNRFMLNFLVKGVSLTTLEANRQTNPITIGPGTTDIAMTAWVDNVAVLRSLPGIISQFINGGFTDAIQATGVLYAGGLTIPLEQTIQFGTGIGKARISMEFATNEEAEAYFQKSHLYVSSKGGRPPQFSVNGVKKKWPLHAGSRRTSTTMVAVV